MSVQTALPESKTITLTRQGQSTLLECPQCHHLIGADAIDLASGIATCSNCAAQTNIEEVLHADPFRRPEQVIPDGVEVLKLSSMLDIVVDWYRSAPKKLIGSLVFGSFFWNIVLVPLMILFVLSGDLLLVFFFIGHIVTGLALLGYLASMFLNKSHLEVDDQGITIRHEPIPSIFNKTIKIPRQEIDQLFVAKHHQRFGKKKAKVPSYTLHVLTRSGKVIDLLTGMSKDTQLYMEQEIETYLKIRDRPIRTEVKR